MSDSKAELAERVFARIEKMKAEPTATLMFAIALELWSEDRQKISNGFDRASPGTPEPPARSSRHDVDAAIVYFK